MLGGGLKEQGDVWEIFQKFREFNDKEAQLNKTLKIHKRSYIAKGLFSGM